VGVYNNGFTMHKSTSSQYPVADVTSNGIVTTGEQPWPGSLICHKVNHPIRTEIMLSHHVSYGNTMCIGLLLACCEIVGTPSYKGARCV
jgi:hypothetical protein